MAARPGRRSSTAATMRRRGRPLDGSQQPAHPVRLRCGRRGAASGTSRAAVRAAACSARTDGGDTWEEISTRTRACPTACWARSASSISPARSGRVWALVEAEGDKTGLYRSDDFGVRWTMVSPNRDLMHRPWYYTHVFADPGHADTVYVTNLQMWKSTDGGATFSEVTTPHGDNHDLWIDPERSEPHDRGQRRRRLRLVQRRRAVVDDLQPEDRAVLSHRRRQPVSLPRLRHAAGQHLDRGAERLGMGRHHAGRLLLSRHRRERASSPSIPRDHNIVYVGAIGSSPGGAGALQRYDHRTRQIQLVNVWPEESTGIAPKDLKYRFAWTFPIVFSPHDPRRRSMPAATACSAPATRA